MAPTCFNNVSSDTYYLKLMGNKMNKVQRWLSKVLNVQPVVEHVTIERTPDLMALSPKEAELVGDMIIKSMSSADMIGYEFTSKVIEIRHVPLASNKRRARYENTYIIRITESPFED